MEIGENFDSGMPVASRIYTGASRPHRDLDIMPRERPDDQDFLMAIMTEVSVEMPQTDSAPANDGADIEVTESAHR